MYEEMERLLRTLRLSEAEEGVLLAKEDRSNLPEVKWLEAARLLTSRQFSQQLLFSNDEGGMEYGEGGFFLRYWKDLIPGTSRFVWEIGRGSWRKGRGFSEGTRWCWRIWMGQH